jgi:hypothetical protein
VKADEIKVVLVNEPTKEEAKAILKKLEEYISSIY